MDRIEQIQRVEAALKARKQAAKRRRDAAHEVTAQKRLNKPPTPGMLSYLESLLEDQDLGVRYLTKATGREVRQLGDLNYYEVWSLIVKLK